MEDQSITKEQLYRAAVGQSRANFYAPKFLAFENSDSRRSWNWAPVFFGFVWFIYRRMYVFALVFGFLAPVLFYWLSAVAIGLVWRAPAESWLWGVPSFLFNFVLIPMYANYLYFSSVEKRIGALREKLPDDAAVLEQLGGFRSTSIVACIVGISIVAGAAASAIYLQNSGEVKDQISAVIEDLSNLQSAVVKSYIADHAWPDHEVAMGPYERPHTPFVDVLTIDRGTISVRFGDHASELIAGQIISLRPSLSATGAVLWSCGYASQKGTDSPSGPAGVNQTNVERRYLPWRCR
jgi:hypothetical protein